MLRLRDFMTCSHSHLGLIPGSLKKSIARVAAGLITSLWFVLSFHQQRSKTLCQRAAWDTAHLSLAPCREKTCHWLGRVMCPDGASTLAVPGALAGAVEFLAGLSLLFTEPGVSLLLSL